MAVIDLNSRVTDDWNVYYNKIKDGDSKIFVRNDLWLENAGPASMNLSVGDKWYDRSGKARKMTEEGITIKPGQSVLIQTKQKIAVPLNVFGIVFGTGKNIFNNGFVSSGKINPGFHGHLFIGYHNGSDSSILFKPNDLLACCSFFEMKTTLGVPLESYLQPESEPELRYKVIKESRFVSWIKSNWDKIVAIALSLVAIGIGIVQIFVK